MWAEAASGPALFPYHDTVGKLTIGYGRNLDDVGISRVEAAMFLTADIQTVLRECMSLPYWEGLDPVRKIVVADMVYNLGMPKFRQFVNFNEAMLNKDYNVAAFEMRDSKWYRQVTRRASKLHTAMLIGIWE